MKEVGIDISKQKSKVITEYMIRNSTLRVNMGPSFVISTSGIAEPFGIITVNDFASAFAA